MLKKTALQSKVMPLRFLAVYSLLLSLCIGLIGLQLFVPPIIGLADNGDFVKVSGRLDLGPQRRWSGFISTYYRSPQYHFGSDVISSELAPAWLASVVSKNIRPGNVFDIRWLGAVHTLIFVLAFCVLLRLLSAMGWTATTQIASAVAFTVMFTDVMYVAYFNTFYSDAIAIVSLLLAVTSALSWIAEEKAPWSVLALFELGSILFITSKAQHGVLGIFPALFLFLLMLTTGSGRRKIIYAGLCASLLIATFIEVRITPAPYKGQALFNLIFTKIAPGFRDPAHDLQVFGLGPDDAKYVGTNAYQSGSPIPDAPSQKKFAERTGYFRIFRYYARHPLHAFAIMSYDLETNAIHLRPGFLTNYRFEDGFPNPTYERHFDSWSTLRSVIFKLWPSHVMIWHCIFIALAAFIAIKHPNPLVRRAAWLGIGISAMAILEFSFASLVDAEETDRHLLLFHELTDVSVWLFFTATMVWLTDKRFRFEDRTSIEAQRDWLRKIAVLTLFIFGAAALNLYRFEQQTEVDHSYDNVPQFERSLAQLRELLPKRGKVGFIMGSSPAVESEEIRKRYPLAAFTLSPLVVEPGAAPEWVIGYFIDPADAAVAAEGLTLVRDFGNGLMLFHNNL
jgi:hypothetical protein